MRSIKSTKAPNGADRGKYNAYQREYKRRKRETARVVGDRADGGGGVLGGDVQRVNSVVADRDGLGREAAELGDVSRLPSAGRGIEFEVDASAVGPAVVVSEIYARIRPR